MNTSMDWSKVMDNLEAFKAEASGWDHPRHFEYMESIAKWIPSGTTSLLDVGCGSGTGLKVWSKYVSDVTGIDKSQNCVDEAKRRNPDAHVFRMDVRDLSTQGQWDVVVTTGFLKHFSLEEWPYILTLLTSATRNRILFGIGIRDVAEDDGDNIHHIGIPRTRVISELSDDFKIVDIIGSPEEPTFIADRSHNVDNRSA